MMTARLGEMATAETTVTGIGQETAEIDARTGRVANRPRVEAGFKTTPIYSRPKSTTAAAITEEETLGTSPATVDF